jgi:hypothetical protein
MTVDARGDNKRILVSDLAAHPQLGWVAGLLATAKKNIERDGHLTPVLFMRAPGTDGTGRWELGILPLAQFGDFETDAGKDRIAFWMRRFLREHKATSCAMMIDIFYTAFDPLDSEMQAMKDIPPAEWPPELLAKARRREAVGCMVEEGGHMTAITQFYHRDRGRIVFEECEVADNDGGDGRFTWLLGRPKAAS